jgi:RND family efflux transporter MFP subunit
MNPNFLPQPLRYGWLLLPVALTAACSGKETPPEPLRPVLTQVIGSSTASATGNQYSGEVRARVESQLAFRTAGKVTERLVNAGSAVQPGQVLAQLDPSDNALNAGAAQAQADLAEAEARRYRELRSKNFVSQAALDARETTLKSARAQAALAGNQKAYTVLKADQPGVIAQVLAEVGQVVTAGQPVFRFSRLDSLEVAIAIPESRIAAYKVGDSASVTLWSGDEKAAGATATTVSATLPGRIRELSQVADSATRTYAARVSIGEASGALRLGMTATVRFDGKPGGGVKVPLGAIFQQGAGKPAVWVVSPEQTVILRPVTVKAWQEDAALLESGVQQGERIVIAGVHKLTAGEKIRVAGQDAAAVKTP